MIFQRVPPRRRTTGRTSAMKTPGVVPGGELLLGPRRDVLDLLLARRVEAQAHGRIEADQGVRRLGGGNLGRQLIEVALHLVEVRLQVLVPVGGNGDLVAQPDRAETDRSGEHQHRHAVDEQLVDEGTGGGLFHDSGQGDGAAEIIACATPGASRSGSAGWRRLQPPRESPAGGSADRPAACGTAAAWRPPRSRAGRTSGGSAA